MRFIFDSLRSSFLLLRCCSSGRMLVEGWCVIMVGVRAPSRTGKMTGEIARLLGLKRRRVPFGGRECHAISLKGLFFKIPLALAGAKGKSAGLTRGVSAVQLVDPPSPMMAPDSRVRRKVPIGICPQRSTFCTCPPVSFSPTEVCNNSEGSTRSGSRNETSTTSCKSTGGPNG